MKELILKAKTEITANNLPEFAKELRNVLASVNTDLKTDDDFAEAKDLVKKFDTSEKALKEAKEKIFESGGLAEINALINELSAECRDVRLKLNRTVTTKEQEVKQGLINTATATIKNAFDNSVMYAYLTVDYSDIAEQIKGKKLLSKMEEALNNYVGVKVNAIQIEETALLGKLKLIKQLIQGNENLFNLESLMRNDDYENYINSRIQANNEAIAEKAKIEAARLVEQQRQAEAKAKADGLAAEARDQDIRDGEATNGDFNLGLAENNQPEIIGSDLASGSDYTATMSVDSIVNNTMRLPSKNRYRIRLDVTCTLEEAVFTANELKKDFARLNADVSLNLVNQEKVA